MLWKCCTQNASKFGKLSSGHSTGKYLFSFWSQRRQCQRMFKFSSVQFSRSVVSDSLGPHELQHTRPPCPSPTPGVHPNSCPLSLWCHPAISSSVVPFSSCPQSLPASESFPMSQLFAWGGQSIGVSALASVLPKYTQDWSPLKWTGWISLQSKGLSRVCLEFPGSYAILLFTASDFASITSHIHNWVLLFLLWLHLFILSVISPMVSSNISGTQPGDFIF